ncbi:MAG: hopanoid-associated phosphorylase [Pseudomonadota bacterium]
MILAVTGLQRERQILAGPDVEVIVGGGDAVRLEAALDRAAVAAHGIISIGIAGGLAPGLRPGRWIVASAVRDGEAEAPTDAGWADRLSAALPQVIRGVVVGVDVIAATAARKAALRAASGAVAVDMESHVAARIARRHRLPLAVARVVSDGPQRTLPPATRVAMRPDGGVDLAAVLRSLLVEPWQLPALLRTAVEAERAFRALGRGRRLLGRGLGAGVVGGLVGPNVVQLPPDVV